MGRPAFNVVGDVVSGVIMGATSVPQLIAYAETVGYASYRGLSTAGPPLLAWGLVTGSPFMNAGVTSITALMCKSDLDGESYVAEHGEEKYVELVAAYSVWVGIASLALGAIGFGKLARSVPKVVRSGFKWGCAIGVLVSAVPNGFFAKGTKELKGLVAENELLTSTVLPYKSTFPGLVNVTNFWFALLQPWLWSLVPATLFILGTIFVMQGKSYLPKFLPPGTEVILLTAAATAYSMYFDYQGAVVGEIPVLSADEGLSLFGGRVRLPVQVLDISKLVEAPLVDRFGGSWLRLGASSLIFAGVNFLSIMGIASGFESDNGIDWSAQREMAAQAVSCFVAAAVGSAPVSGSLSRSLVARMTGATSQGACLITALCWIYLQPYMSIMSPTPKAALSAVICSAVLKGVVTPKDLLQLGGLDALIAWGTGIMTALTSPTQGFGLGLALYLVVSLVRGTPKEKKA